MFDECPYCHEQIEFKECRITPRSRFVWHSPIDQGHVFAECIPFEQLPEMFYFDQSMNH